VRGCLVKVYVEHYNDVRLNSAVEAGVYRGFGFPGADRLRNMFQFN
jgi:hypothetical protein